MKSSIQELHDFLQGKLPNQIMIAKKHIPKLTAEQAMNVIWYLQEHMKLLPSNFEMCVGCNYIYDSNSEGHWDDVKGGWCDSCLTQHAPNSVKKRSGIIY